MKYFRSISNVDDRSNAEMMHSVYVYKEKDKERKRLELFNADIYRAKNDHIVGNHFISEASEEWN